MILTGNEILKAVGDGRIIIAPFSSEHLGPNSYDLTLGNEVILFTPEDTLDMKKNVEGRRIILSEEEGFVLEPNHLLIGHTVETTETRGLVPLLEGRSSTARLGISVHLSAGVGDIGFCGSWTLEMTSTVPVRIYPFTRICQILYFTVLGEVQEYEGKYQFASVPICSRMYQELG